MVILYREVLFGYNDQRNVRKVLEEEENRTYGFYQRCQIIYEQLGVDNNADNGDDVCGQFSVLTKGIWSFISWIPTHWTVFTLLRTAMVLLQLNREP